MSGTLPKFDLSGYLPPGWHTATVDSFRNRCVDEISDVPHEGPDEYRAKLFAGYLKLYDATGKILMNRIYRDFSGEMNETMDLRGYPGGLYIVQLVHDNQTSTRKLVLE